MTVTVSLIGEGGRERKSRWIIAKRLVKLLKTRHSIGPNVHVQSINWTLINMLFVRCIDRQAQTHSQSMDFSLYSDKLYCCLLLSWMKRKKRITIRVRFNCEMCSKCLIRCIHNRKWLAQIRLTHRTAHSTQRTLAVEANFVEDQLFSVFHLKTYLSVCLALYFDFKLGIGK